MDISDRERAIRYMKKQKLLGIDKLKISIYEDKLSLVGINVSNADIKRGILKLEIPSFINHIGKTGGIADNDMLFGPFASVSVDLDVTIKCNADLSYLFCGCKSDKIIVRGISNSVTNMHSMFRVSYCKEVLFIDNDTSSVTDMGSMFKGCVELASVNINELDTSSVINMSGMFASCMYLKQLDISKLNMSKVETASQMFSGCGSLVDLRMGTKNTGRLYDISDMFNSCFKLAKIGISKWDLSNVENAKGLFASTELVEFNFSDYNFKHLKYIDSMFDSCLSLKRVDLSGLSNVRLESISNLFGLCKYLEHVEFGELDLRRVVDFSKLFYNCGVIEQIDLSKVHTINVKNMQLIFSNCYNLKKLDLRGLNLCKDVKSVGAFRECENCLIILKPSQSNTVAILQEALKNKIWWMYT